jgi:DNA modification methylase
VEECSIFNVKEELFRFVKQGDVWIPKVMIGDIRKLADLLPDSFIDCVITSPPYWMQRDYKHPNQIGREETPEQYVKTIANVFELLRPKLKKTATVFLNVGYKYLQGRLILIPEMIALEMEKKQFVLKNKIIWWKPNAMPSPARDRLNDVYEPVLFFIRDDGKDVHYFNLEEISQKTKTLEHFVSLLSVNPEELLGVRATDPISEKEKKEGKVIGTRFMRTKIYEILIQWDDGIREWMSYGGPLKNYPEKINFTCPLCKSSLSEWDIRLSFANSGKMICPQCEAMLCESAETFPIPQFPSFTEGQQETEAREIINPNIETKKYVTKVPKSSKFIRAGLNEISMASPAGRLAIQGEYFTIKRRWEAPQHLIAKFLKFWREQKGVSIEDIDKELGYSYTAGHWFRLDFGWWGKGGSIPKPMDWERLKKLLGFNDIYDRLVTERVAVLQTVKPHEEGRNPGDIWKITPNEYIEELLEELKDYLKSNIQEFGDIWKIVLEPYSEAHFSIFPTKLVETAIKLGCSPNGVVLDPFAGSGTVGQVAMRLGRKAILIELLPEFLDLMKKRCGRIEVLPI